MSMLWSKTDGIFCTFWTCFTFFQSRSSALLLDSDRHHGFVNHFSWYFVSIPPMSSSTLTKIVVSLPFLILSFIFLSWCKTWDFLSFSWDFKMQIKWRKKCINLTKEKYATYGKQKRRRHKWLKGKVVPKNL